jgi:hypothetical protein
MGAAAESRADWVQSLAPAISQNMKNMNYRSNRAISLQLQQEPSLLQSFSDSRFFVNQQYPSGV